MNIKKSICGIRGWTTIDIGKSKNILKKSKVNENYIAKHQKRKEVSIQLQTKVRDGLKKPICQRHIEKLKYCFDQNCNSTIVFAVKKNSKR